MLFFITYQILKKYLLGRLLVSRPCFPDGEEDCYVNQNEMVQEALIMKLCLEKCK
jgi:hypothetical protein